MDITSSFDQSTYLTQDAGNCGIRWRVVCNEFSVRCGDLMEYYRDTVSSVGIIPRAHPYTSVNYAVKYFRHALALDERRARFRPNVWNEPTLEREQELDVDKPDVEFPDTDSRDDWTYRPPNRDLCDVKEVWFSGKNPGNKLQDIS
jgi:uncharacterized protein (DUF2235 family)